MPTRSATRATGYASTGVSPIRRRWVILVASLSACSGTTDEPATRRDRATHTESSTTEPSRETPRAERLRPVDDVPALPPATYPMPARLVAIGDVHGDVSAFRQVLRAAEAIDLADHWSGGALVVVQNGDLLDRGDDEPEILALVSQLEREAEAAGGHFLALNGNHELMNAQLDFRYVTEDGFRDFHRYRDEASSEARHEVPRPAYGRAGAFEPRSHFARQFASRNTVVVVGDTVFVHGGVTPAAARLGLDTVNRAARDFFLGAGPLSSILASEESPIWYRGYAVDDGPETCAQLTEALESLHAARMVVGHTVQEGGVTHACEGRVFRVDVGLARLYDGPIQALEITAPYSPAMGGTTGTRVIEGSR